MSSGSSARENAPRLLPAWTVTNERRAAVGDCRLASAPRAGPVLAMNPSREEACAYSLRGVREPLGLDALVNLLAVHRHVLGRRKTEAQLVAPDAEHSDGDVIADFH